MTAERLRALLFDVAARMQRARTFLEHETAAAQYRALKNKWNQMTNNAVLCAETFENKLANNAANAYTLDYTNGG